ncbi:MAG TPA: pilus assembly protein PilB, partial [Rubrivivax sp.]|nr:pilus assembly protein PilB [Rubrivivax sp.]
MSDLSLLPLSLTPIDAETVPAAFDPTPVVQEAPERREPFAWPTPPFAVYPPPACAIEPEPCEIEGMNGKILHGRLVEFDLERLTALLQVPASRNPVPVRFAQCRRLMLLQPLAPLPGAASDPLQRPDSVPFQVLLKGLPALQGRTVGHREDDYGLFLFEPVDAVGGVRRSFVPRGVYERVAIGDPAAEASAEAPAAKKSTS